MRGPVHAREDDVSDTYLVQLLEELREGPGDDVGRVARDVDERVDRLADRVVVLDLGERGARVAWQLAGQAGSARRPAGRGRTGRRATRTLLLSLLIRTTTIFCCGVPAAAAPFEVLEYGELPWITVGEGPATLVFEPLLRCTRPAACGWVLAAVDARRAGMSGRAGRGACGERVVRKFQRSAWGEGDGGI